MFLDPVPSPLPLLQAKGLVVNSRGVETLRRSPPEIKPQGHPHSERVLVNKRIHHARPSPPNLPTSPQKSTSPLH